jgi:hypothetical protein
MLPFAILLTRKSLFAFSTYTVNKNWLKWLATPALV